MDDMEAALAQAEAQLTAIGTLYEADLELQRVSPSLRGKIKAFVENERLALDLLARRASIGQAHTHYPLASEGDGFESSMAKNMPGAAHVSPEVTEAIGRHQPFKVISLADLRDLLLDENKRRLTPRTRPAPVDVAAPPPAVEAPAVRPPPSGGTGGGLTGPLFINGVEYDPITLQPLNPVPQPRRETIYVDWLFAGSETPALKTLAGIHAAVLAAVAEVSAAIKSA